MAAKKAYLAYILVALITDISVLNIIKPFSWNMVLAQSQIPSIAKLGLQGAFRYKFFLIY